MCKNHVSESASTCMIVDDEQDLVDTLSEYLKLRGFEIVATANDGCAAASLYKDKNPDYVILDLNMPKYDGMHAINEIRTINKHSKFIVISGNAEQEKNLNLDNLLFLKKPFKMDRLIQMMERFS